MPNKVLKTRIQNKIDSLANLQRNNPYLLSGELVTAYATAGVKLDNGQTVQRKIAYIYVGPGNFNDLLPIVGPSSDVKNWAKVDHFIDVVIEGLTKTTDTGDVADGDTVNNVLNKINNNFANIKQQIDDLSIPTKTSDLTNDGEGQDAAIRDFATGYQNYQFVSYGSIKKYLDDFNLGDLSEVKKQLEAFKEEVNQNLAAVDEKFKLYYTKTEIDELLKAYLKEIQIGDKNGGVKLNPTNAAITSSQLWDQIKDTSKPDIQGIAGAAASTALEQAKDYTNTKLSEFITISYKGPYDSYAALLVANPDGGKAGIIYLVKHNHNTNDSYDSTDSDIFDEYIWVVPESGTPGFEKVGNTDVKLASYLQAALQEDKTAVQQGDDGAVAKIELVEEPIGSGNKVLKVTYKTIVKNETFSAGRVAVGFGNGALKSTALVNIPLANLPLASAVASSTTINTSTTLGHAIRILEKRASEAKGVKRVDIATDGGVEVSGGPITSKGTLKVTHSPRPTADENINTTLGSTVGRNYIRQIALDKYGHIVKVTTGEETAVDSYATGSTFTASNDKIELSIGGTGPNFKAFSASLNSLPAALLTQTDGADDFLVFYCGTSNVLASTEVVNYN